MNRALGNGFTRSVRCAARGVIVIAGLTAAPPLAAQSSSTPKGTPYFDITFEKLGGVAAKPMPGTKGPAFPEMFRAAGIEGAVTVEFIIDTLGRVERESVRFVKGTMIAMGKSSPITSDDDEFVKAVRVGLDSMRFSPARLKDRTVRFIVQQQFQFSLKR